METMEIINRAGDTVRVIFIAGLACLAIATGIAAPAHAQDKTARGNAAADSSIQPNAISDETLRAEYERFKSEAGDTEYRVAHIMLSNQDAAQQIVARLKKGESFSELAKIYSTDPGTAKRGGDLDWSSPSAFTPNFALAVKQTTPGTYTVDPVRTPFGWHVIRVDAVRPARIPAFEDVKEAIRKSLQAKQAK
jgi:peptidyl-prolyl cis-trans isomerase C